MTKDKNPKLNPSRYPNNIPLKIKDKFPYLPSFSSVTNSIAKPTLDTSSTNANIRALVLDDQDLINVEDPSMMLLVKLKDVNSMGNMYVICRNEGFTELKIHHVGGLWIWIQFSSSSSADNSQTNASLKSVYSSIKTITPSFKVDERMIWIKICGLPLCAWGSNAYKKVADMFGKFMFFEVHEVKDSVEENSLDLNELNDLKETINELARNEI
ncbi:RNA-directed DNA polymerase, eukaryota [Tanacetum coccineum]